MKKGLKNKIYFEQHLLIYQDDILYFILSRVKISEYANEIRQRTFLKAWEHLDQLNDPQKGKEWLFTIANREILAFWNEENRQKQHKYEFQGEESSVDAKEGLFDESESALEILIKNDNLELMNESFQKLSEKEKLFLSMRYLQEMTPLQISKILDINQNTVRSSVKRALEHLRGEFEKLD